MFFALRSTIAHLVHAWMATPVSAEEPEDVTHLLEAVSAPLPVVVGSPPAMDVGLPGTPEWGDELGEEDAATEQMSERGALRLMSQAGFDAEDTMPRMERYNLDWDDGTQVYLSA